MNFSEMNLSEPILKAVAEAGYVSPSPIQEQTIPIVLTGSDVLGCAQTGTGKTAAFALPILQNLSKRGRSGKIRALVLTPRVSSLCKTMKAFANTANIHPCAAVSSLVEWGSLPGGYVAKGRGYSGGNPGRLNDLIGQGYIKLDGLSIFVLDEADRMLDMGFINDVKRVLTKIPKVRQTLMFSATMPRKSKSWRTPCSLIPRR